MSALYALRAANEANDPFLGCVLIRGGIILSLLREGLLDPTTEYVLQWNGDAPTIKTKSGEPVLFLTPVLPKIRFQGGKS